MKDTRGWVVRHEHQIVSRRVCRACRNSSFWKGPEEPHWVCNPRHPLGFDVLIMAEGDHVPVGCLFLVEHCVSREP